METKRLLFRPFLLSDAEDVYEYGSDPTAVQSLSWPAHTCIQHTRTVLEKFYLPNPDCFPLVCKDNGRCIGSLSLNGLNDTEVSFGLVINPKFWNMGLGTEALKAIIHRMFSSQHSVSVFRGEHFIGNDASGNVMLKSGMRYHGEECFGTDGRIVKVYKITRAEWNASRDPHSVLYSE